MKQNIINKIEKLAREKQNTKTVKNKKGRQSKFEHVYSSIALMRKRRFDWKQIHETLNEGGLKCSYIGLIAWKNKRGIGQKRAANKA